VNNTNWLFSQLKKWVKDGIISGEQAEKIRSRYSKDSKITNFISALLVFGGVLVGLGLILAMASNWQGFSSTIKILIILLFVSGFNYLGYHFYQVPKRRNLSQTFFLMGAFAFGAGVNLVLQTFNISFDTGQELLIWIAGLFLFVKFFELFWVLILANILLTIWIFQTGISWIDIAVYGLLAFFFWKLIFRDKNNPALVFSLIGTSLWLFLLQLRMLALPHAEKDVDIWFILPRLDFGIGDALGFLSLYVSFGVLLSVLAINRVKEWAAYPFSILGIIFVYFTQIPFTFFHNFANEDGFQMPNPGYPIEALPFIAISAFVITISLDGLRSSSKSKKLLSRFFVAISLVNILLPFLSYSNPMAISIFMNLILLFELIAFLYISNITRNWKLFKWSLWLFKFFILLRFFDIFSTLLNQALLFVLGGALLIWGGVFIEKQSKKIFDAGVKGD